MRDTRYIVKELTYLHEKIQAIDNSLLKCLNYYRSIEKREISWENTPTAEDEFPQWHQITRNIKDLATSLEGFDGEKKHWEHISEKSEGCDTAQSSDHGLQKIRESAQGVVDNAEKIQDDGWRWPLLREEYQRYSRQLIMPEIGLFGQQRLKKSSVLIVGVGGLGCPAAVYLAGAGIGKIGLMDGDIVEESNLHRQILHNGANVGITKVDSAIKTLQQTNSLPRYVPHREHVSSQNALSTFSSYDLVLDCTDHPTSRYLISDACVLSQIPLVSASALKTDGQLTTLNYPPAVPGSPYGGPCYRCLFPKPPPAESVLSCGEGGILGPIVGVMGVLQALEAIKLLSKGESTGMHEYPKTSMLLFSGYSSQPFRTVTLRGRKQDCQACSRSGSITKQSLASGSVDYIRFCGLRSPVNVLEPHDRISALKLAEELKKTYIKSPVIVDVREKVQYDLCSLPDSRNVPYSFIDGWNSLQDIPQDYLFLANGDTPMRFICRYGNDSQLALKKLKDLGLPCWADGFDCLHVDGGLEAWREHVDKSWPDY